MDKYILQWSDYLKSKKKAIGTIKAYTDIVKDTFKNEKNLETYESCIEAYASKIQKLKDTTIASRMYALTNFQDWLIKEGKLDSSREVDITWKYIPSKLKKKHVEIITPEEQIKLFDSCEDIRDKLAFTILLGTGIRISEFDALDDIDALINNELIPVSGKSISSREIFISQKIKDMAIEFRSVYGNELIWPKSYTGRDKRLKAVATKAGLILNLHMFRSTFATEWVYKGHSIIQLQQAMGHSSLSQLEPYVQNNQLELKRSWEEFSTGIDYFDKEFLIAENKYLKEKLKKYEIKFRTNK